MVEGADERKMPPEVADEEITVSWSAENTDQETVASAVPAEAPVEGEQRTAGDIPDEVARQITQPIIPALGLPANDSIGQPLSETEAERLRIQAEEEEARLVSQVLIDRARDPSEPPEELLDVVTRETVTRLLGERVTSVLPAQMLAIWRHEVLAAHWRAFGSLEEWTPAISRAWERTEQQLQELHQCLERWLPTHPYVDEVINLAEDVHGPPRWFRRFLLKSERSFHKWLDPVSEGEEVLVDILALTRYATTELEHAAAWYVLQRNVVETEVHPDQIQLVEALGGLRAVAELIREAFGGRSREIRILSLASGAAGGGRLELELTRRLGKDWRLTIHATDPDALTVARSLAGARVTFLQAQARGEIAPESTFHSGEVRPYDLSSWEPDSFDLVLMVGGLHHLRLADQARCLVEAQRVGKLVMLLEPLYGEAARMEEFCRPLVTDGEREPSRLSQRSSWARRALGKGAEPALLHPTGAQDAIRSCERALTVDEMRRLVAASGSSYMVRPLDDGKTPGRPQWLAIIGSAG